MTTELYWLTLSLLLTAILWLPYIVNRLIEQGFDTALLDPDGKTESQVGWATRLMAAHANAVENLVIFAPLVIVVHLSGTSNTTTSFACILYFFARLTHAIVFTLRIPFFRVAAFAGGFIAQLLLIVALLMAQTPI
ncbi:MAG: MAPEG family protein [Methylococcales bacterium]|jgi:uncharacterized MAPEG superfamily protein|nr:MAPEG family protein [Methylococcales bacterium]